MLRTLLFLILSAALIGGCARQSPQSRSSEEGSTQQQSDSSEVDRLYEVAAALFKQGKLDDALAPAKRAAELREKIEGRDSTSTAQAILLLANIDRLMGRGDQAEPLYRRAVSLLEKRPDAQSDYSFALEGYACVLSKAGRVDDARKYGRRASDLIGRLDGNTANAAKPDAHGALPDPVNHVQIIQEQPRSSSNERVAGSDMTIPVEVTVDETGRVILACAQSGEAELREPGERAAYRWRFSPTLQDGVPVKVVGIISFKFDPAVWSEKH